MIRLHTIAFVTMMILITATVITASPSHHRYRQRHAVDREASAAASASTPPATAASHSARLEVPPFTGAIDPRILKTPIHAADVQAASKAASSIKQRADSPAHPAQPCHAEQPSRDQSPTVKHSSDNKSLKQKARNVLDALMQRIKDIRQRFEHKESRGE